MARPALSLKSPVDFLDLCLFGGLTSLITLLSTFGGKTPSGT
jgi:hypothetical protein